MVKLCVSVDLSYSCMCSAVLRQSPLAVQKQMALQTEDSREIFGW